MKKIFRRPLAILLLLIPLSAIHAGDDPSGELFFELKGGSGVGRAAQDIEGTLRGGLPDPLHIGYYTLRYGSTAEVLRNYALGKLITRPVVDTSDSLELMVGWRLTERFDVGLSLLHANYLIRNTPVNLVGGKLSADETTLVLGTALLENPNPPLRDQLIQLEYLDRLLVRNAYALETLSLDCNLGLLLFRQAKLDSYLRLFFGAGRELRLKQSLLEYGAILGFRHRLTSQVSILFEAGEFGARFSGGQNGFAAGGELQQPRIRLGAIFTPE